MRSEGRRGAYRRRSRDEIPTSHHLLENNDKERREKEKTERKRGQYRHEAIEEEE